MEALIHVIEVYGLWVVFICVLVDQGGLPFPAYAPMIVTAALAVEADQSLLPIVIVAIFATVVADLLWFAGGRRFGTSLLRLMCKLSLSPDSCVGMTRRAYDRWGAPSLIFAKYVPGFAAVATTLAGETGISLKRFVLYDAIGAALWACGAIALGAIFHDAVEAVLTQLELLGRYAALLLIAALLLFIAVKWWRRHRFLVRFRMARISPSDLHALLESGSPVAVLDVRSEDRRRSSGWIPGSIYAPDVSNLPLPPNEDVVVYCDCPNEASAAIAARKLQQRGFQNVRPLAGGVEAWRSQGLPLDGLAVGQPTYTFPSFAPRV
jgi:membrane protein DedA with SNARE-associated domain/rhodanese-related sulfurtransferase